MDVMVHRVKPTNKGVEGGGNPAALKANSLQLAINKANEGDIIELAPGTYKGGIKIFKTLTIKGGPGVRLDGEGKGSVIWIDAPDVTVQGLTIVNSGADHVTKDSGIFLGKKAHRATILHNHLEGNLVGVYLWGQRDVVVSHNVIIGRQDAHMNDRGNGIYVWNAPGALVEGNDIRFGRDGIFVNASNKNRFIGNRIRNTRYAIHYMYTHSSVVSDNVVMDSTAGYSLMFSKNLTVTGNLNINSKRHGILLNYANNSIFENNMMVNSGERCVFIYNSNKNRFAKNWFEGCDVGIHFTGGSERNAITENSFLNNENQVKYVGTRWVDWSANGKGNYWSDNPAFDLDGDGFGDTPYKPNDMVDQIVWRHPTAKTLLTSPAIKILRWVQGQFPALYPGGVIDRSPLMKPIHPKLDNRWATPFNQKKPHPIKAEVN
jgi:nitrous oxidase accessory protein